MTASCAPKKTAEPPPVAPSNPEAEKTPEPEQEVFGKPTVKSFDLGVAEIKQSSGKNMPYHINGVIGVPTGTSPRPVVIIVHGNHPVKKYDDPIYAEGFTYLVEDLAEQGYLALSVNVFAHRIWEYGEPIGNVRLNAIMKDHFDKLDQAVKGTDPGYGLDLKNRANLKQVSYIGHSQGGTEIYEIALERMKQGSPPPDGMLLVAPGGALEMERLPDVPTAFLTPQYDGDLSGLIGYRVFDFYSDDAKRSSWTAMTYIYGANHNFFNSKLEGKDDGVQRAKENDNLRKRLTAAEQRDFLSKYAVDFLGTVYGTNPNEMLYEFNQPQAGSLYGHPVLTSLVQPKRMTDVWNADKEQSSTQNAMGGAIVTEGVSIRTEVESYIPNKDETGAYMHAGEQEGMKLNRVNWQKGGGRLTLEIPEDKRDLSGMQSLSLYMAVDSANKLNAAGQNQALTITLHDTSGNESKVVLDSSTPALTYQQGKLLDNEFMAMWSTFAPLSTARIPMASFTDIDLKQVDRLSLVFDQTDQGSLMIRNIRLVK
ncbi:alpha/beta hydrolase [Paenibacillus swuensis]|nr:hypothetical protein [Paenibacillus swuensis]